MQLKHDSMVTYFICHYKIPQIVPLEGEMSYEEIAQKTGKLTPKLVSRVLRHAATLQIFRETSPGSGKVVHTAASACLHRDHQLRSWIGHNFDEVARGDTMVCDQIDKYGDNEESGQSAMFLAINGGKEEVGKTIFDLMASKDDGESQGWRFRRFGESMQCVARGAAFDVRHINNGFDWDGLGKVKMVDLGGNVGHIAVEIASKHPNIDIVVQDFAALEGGFNANTPDNLKDRVTFQVHNFFTEQPVKDADIYFFKHILHDWSDRDNIRILRALLPAMKNGKRIFVVDNLLPPPGVLPLTIERVLTSLDMQMLTCNGKERTREDWEWLFTTADPRYKIKAFTNPPGYSGICIDVVFEE